jgi:hypothetical protein
MKLWDNIRNYFYRKNLAARLSQLKTKRSVINLHDAKSVGILYDSTDAANDITITRLAEELKTQGKTVEVLGYINDTKTEHKADIPLFNKKDVAWTRVPGGSKVDSFANKEFDLLLACFPGESLPLEYILHISRAKWRVGPYAANKTACYDMMINTGEHTGLPYLIQQTVYFLNQIKYDTN